RNRAAAFGRRPFLSGKRLLVKRPTRTNGWLCLAEPNDQPESDRSVIVCGAMWNVLGTIDRLETEKRRAGFRAFARSVFRPVFDAVGWKPQGGESQDTAKLRSDLI